MSPFEWDEFSDQPKVIQDKAFKRRMRMRYLADYLKMLATSAVVFPAGLVHMAISKQGSSARSIRDLVGIGVNLNRGPEQFDLVDELGINHVLIRMPIWDAGNIDSYRQFASEFKRRGKSVLVNILQDREHIESEELLRRDIGLIFGAFTGVSREFQIGNAVNRVKWGFFSVQEYLEFFMLIQALRDSSFPHYQLIGPSVIDFEYHFTIRALFNRYRIKFDRLSALLYVDRMGSPRNKQYGFFDTNRKILLLSSLDALSSKVRNSSFYITEVNWPLKGTTPYAPTSETECVTSNEYAQFMLDYLQIAQHSGKVERVYWHQLIAPGYGLVDNRSGKTKKLDAFYKLKSMMSNHVG